MHSETSISRNVIPISRNTTYDNEKLIVTKENSENKKHQSDQTPGHIPQNSGTFSNSNQKNDISRKEHDRGMKSSSSVQSTNYKLEFCSLMESDLHRIIQDCKQGDTKLQLESFIAKFELEVQKIRIYCTDLEQCSERLMSKLREAEKQELDNLELHLQMDAKMRALETFIKVSPMQPGRASESISCQTELQYNELQRKECLTDLAQKDL